MLMSCSVKYTKENTLEKSLKVTNLKLKSSVCTVEKLIVSAILLTHAIWLLAYMYISVIGCKHTSTIVVTCDWTYLYFF